VRREIPERKSCFWCERKSFFGRNQREGIGAQGKSHNSNSKQRKFQVRGVFLVICILGE